MDQKDVTMNMPTEKEMLDLVLETLNLEIDFEFTPTTPLFGDSDEGTLGLDSIDALEIGAVVRQRFGVQMKADDEASRNAMYCVKNLHAFVCDAMSKTGQMKNAVVSA